jgi:signal transduction histidine kinase/ActR/RegA family two-component response regulator
VSAPLFAPAPASILTRARRSSLSVKLAVLGAAVTAAVLGLALLALSREARSNTRAVFMQQLARNQRTLQQVQARDKQQLLFAASVIAQVPQLEAAMSTFQLERNTAGLGRGDRGAAVNTAEQVFREQLRNVDADLLLATDDSGRVLAQVGRRGISLPYGSSLRQVPAVSHAIDPTAPLDTGAVTVLRSDSAYVFAAVYPLVQNGFTLGALVLGRRLDSSFVAAESATASASVVLTAGRSIVAASDSALATASLATALNAYPVDTSSAIIIGGNEYVVAPVTIGHTQDNAAVRLWMLQSLSQRVAALMQPLRRDFLLYGALAVLLAAVGAVLVAGTILRPFKRFVAHMRSDVAAEERQDRFEAANAAQEVRSLNDSFNQLMDSLAARRHELEQRTAELVAANVVLTDEVSERARVEQALRESQAQLRQSQKLEAIGTLAGGIAHDFNNLITVISGYTQLALMRTNHASPEAEDLRQVVEASDRAANLTHQLLAFSRKQVLQPTVLDLSDVVKGIAPMLRRIIGDHIVLEIMTEEPLARARADRGQLEQVLLNLAVNARDAMPGGGRLRLATSNCTDNRRVLLQVTDTGTGMTADVRERVFEPFFTTKEPGKGTGLGLSTVYGIINQSGGTIEVESQTGRGTTFTIALPAAEAMVTAAVGPMVEEHLPRGTETVLIVEDAEDVRILARRTLEERGYNVLVARNADEALEIAMARAIDLLLTDIVMPHTSGPQLVTKYLVAHPATAVIYMSGYADDALTQYELDPATVFLRKPFTPAVLARTVRAALDGRAAPAHDRVGSAAD